MLTRHIRSKQTLAKLVSSLQTRKTIMRVALKIAFVITLVQALIVYRDSEISLDESYASLDYTVLECKGN